MQDKYRHMLPINIPFLFIMLGLKDIPMFVLIYRIPHDPILWSSVLQRLNFAPEIIFWTTGALAVDMIFICLGVWLWLHREKKLSD